MNGGPLLPLAATAAVALRGFVSERSLGASLVVVAGSLGFGALLAEASVAHEGRIDADVAWAAAGMLGWFLSLAHGAGLMGRRGVLGSFAFARPVSPGLLLAGRCFGLAAGLSLYAAAVTLILVGWLSGWREAAPAVVCGTGWLLLLRLLVVLAVSTFFLALLRPAAAAFLAAVVCVSGWFAGPLAPASSSGVLLPLTVAARFLLPDFRALQAPLGGLPGEPSAVLAALAGPTLYAALYAAAMLIAALTVFPVRVRRAGIS